MPSKEDLYRIPATQVSIGALEAISRELTSHGPETILDPFKRVATFRHGNSGVIRIEAYDVSKVNDIGQTIADVEGVRVRIAKSTDNATKGGSYSIYPTGEIKYYDWNRLFGMEEIDLIGMIQTLSEEEIEEVSGDFLNSFSVSEDLGLSFFTEGELLELIAELKLVDPSTQMIRG